VSSTRVLFATLFVLGTCGAFSLSGLAQAPESQEAVMPSPCSLSPESNVPALLKRVEDILIAAEKTRSKGDVTIDRTLVDEMRADLEQIRASLGR
jgi:hypothetical protein